MSTPERIAILRAILAANAGNSGKCQADRLLEAMQRLGSVTTSEARRYVDVYHVPARKLDLINRGYPVVMVWDFDTTEAGESHRVGRYSLARGATQ